MNFEATARFILRFDSSGWLRLLSISKSSRNLSIVSSSRCLLFSKRIIAWCPCTHDPKRFNKISKIFSAVIATLLLLLGLDTVQGCPFQVTGERTAFLSLRQVLFLEMQFHYLHPGFNTAIRFVFIASWFLKHSFGLLTAFIGSGLPCKECLQRPFLGFKGCVPCRSIP